MIVGHRNPYRGWSYFRTSLYLDDGHTLMVVVVDAARRSPGRGRLGLPVRKLSPAANPAGIAAGQSFRVQLVPA
jgi:hypothetical protein